MSADVSDYLSLITSWHRNKPKFVETVSASVQPLADVQDLLGSIPAAFDLDIAVGVQLDRIGERVGASRDVPVPLVNLFFSLDDPARGLDFGVWQGPYDTTTGLAFLDDNTFRRLLRARILANSWDGTIPGAQAALDAFFDDPATYVFIEDEANTASPPLLFTLDSDEDHGLDAGVWSVTYFTLDSDPAHELDFGVWKTPLSPGDVPDFFNMAMEIVVSGKMPSAIDLAVLRNGRISIKPAGVQVDYAVTSVDGAAVFGLDIENQFISGLDVGAWGIDLHRTDYIFGITADSTAITADNTNISI